MYLKIQFLNLIFLMISCSTLAQNYNLDSLSHIDYGNLHQTVMNDVWGYVDESGDEYALVGAANGISVVDISDPQNPTEVYWDPSSENSWRDIKTYEDYAYVTTEGNDGLLIIDLSPLPNNPIVSTTNFYDAALNWSSAHNLYIDKNGYGYIFGSDYGNGGAIIYDLFTDPMNPQRVGTFDNWYIHDGVVRNDTLFAAHINDGFFTLVDVSVKSNPVVLGSHSTPSDFSHNIWPSEDGKYVFTTDELTNSFIAAYDITDVSNITEVDRIQSSPGDGVVPHNAHVNGDYLVTSYYADGLVVHDIKNPSNMIEVARYDTYPGTADYTIGNWGAYPFFPSGTIIVSDIENGLFILGPQYSPAARLRGTVTNIDNGDPIQGAEVHILASNQNDFTTINGLYETGYHSSGTYDVSYKKYGYIPQTISTTITSNTTETQDVALTALPTFDFTVNVVDELGNPILGAKVKIEHDENTFLDQTNGLGEVVQSLSYEDTYEVTAGKWGEVTTCTTLFLDPSVTEITLELKVGYMDDFTFDFGWSSFGTATSGDWERAVPLSSFVTGTHANPDVDSEYDCGDMAYVTDNRPGSIGSVMEGEVILKSPVFDLSSYTDPYINFERWFYNFYGYTPFNDTLKTLLSNGTKTVVIDKQGFDESLFETWVPISKRVSDYLAPTSSMQLTVRTSNFVTSENITDAGFDNFVVTDGEGWSVAVAENSRPDEQLAYPNPFVNTITVPVASENKKIELFSIQGKKITIEIKEKKSNNTVINTSNLSPGMYILTTGSTVQQLIKR